MEFGWQVDYIVFKLPLVYVNAYLELIKEKHDAEKAAANGRGYVPNTEYSQERVDAKKAMIRKHYSKVDEADSNGPHSENHPGR